MQDFDVLRRLRDPYRLDLVLSTNFFELNDFAKNVQRTKIPGDVHWDEAPANGPRTDDQDIVDGGFSKYYFEIKNCHGSL